MGSVFPRICCLGLLAALAVAGCRHNNNPPPQANSAPPPAATVAAPSPIEFDLASRATGQFIGTYRRNADGTWSGPHPQTGAPVQFTASSTNPGFTMYTDGPPIMTLIVDYTHDQVKYGSDPAGWYNMTRSILQ